MPRTGIRPRSTAACSAAAGRFSAIEPTSSAGVPLAARAAPKARRVGHHVASSSPTEGKSSTSSEASNAPSSTAVKQLPSASSSPQMKVW